MPYASVHLDSASPGGYRRQTKELQKRRPPYGPRTRRRGGGRSGNGHAAAGAKRSRPGCRRARIRTITSASNARGRCEIPVTVSERSGLWRGTGVRRVGRAGGESRGQDPEGGLYWAVGWLHDMTDDEICISATHPLDKPTPRSSTRGHLWRASAPLHHDARGHR